MLFADRLLEHFRRSGVDLAQLVVQTDHGSEFGGTWNRRHGLPPFTKLVEQTYGCGAHRFNPPHRSTYNSDVEAVHGLMEPEFYELERFRGSVRQFLNQVHSYQFYFNLLRRNRNRGGATPEQLRAARAPTVDPKIFFLPPVLLSSLEAHHLPILRRVVMGQNVPGYVTVSLFRCWQAPEKNRYCDDLQPPGRYLGHTSRFRFSCWKGRCPRLRGAGNLRGYVISGLTGRWASFAVFGASPVAPKFCSNAS
ncbi:MAG TPA: hypothetical protein VNJ11_10965 [Bryobacteraceae bacterium]|nr:hypothetical protein [Bryobacteraceae bacterium]